jgi:hypothetical protein
MLTASRLKKSWVWLKAYWYVPVIAILAIITLVITRKPPQWAFDMIQKNRETAERERSAIDNAEREADKTKQAAEDRFNSVVGEIEKNHTERKNELNRKKEREIKKIIKASGNDPAVITNEIAEKFGFTVVLPEE